MAWGQVLIGGGIEKSISDSKNEITLDLMWIVGAGPEREKGDGDPAIPLQAAQGWADLARGRVSGQDLLSAARSLLSVGGELVNNQFGSLAPYQAGKNPRQPKQPDVFNEQGKAKNAAPVTLEWLDRDLDGVDPTRAIAPATRGTADAVRLAATLLGDHCGLSTQLQAPAGQSRLTAVSDDLTPVTVSVQTNPSMSDDISAVYSGERMPGPYDVYSVRNIYKYDSGQRVLRSTMPGEPGQVVRFANPTLKLTCEWSVRRIGGPPVVPDPNPPGPGGVYVGGGQPPVVDEKQNRWVLISDGTGYDGLEPAGDGVTPSYSISGVYVYEATNPELARRQSPVAPFLDHSYLELAAETAKDKSQTIAFPKEDNAPTSGVGV